MALVIDFNIQQSYNCKELIFTDTTGAYASPGNLTGYGLTGGDPNPQTSTFTISTLTITNSAGTEYEIDLEAEGFPTIYNTTEFLITADLMGGAADTAITDGIYTFVYSGFSDSTNETYTQTKIITLTCNVACCVYSMFKDIDFECDCSKDAKTKALDAWLLFKGLQYSSGCGSTDNFDTDLVTLQKLCLNADCANCR